MSLTDMAKVLGHFRKFGFLYTLIILFGYIFFYHVHYSTLSSWDEAWYGSIAREMVRTGDYFHMIWNGRPYYDHPPLGFWFMALSYRLFGISELTTRLPSLVFGMLAIITMYLTGIELFKRKSIGFVAALILGTSVWYTIRVRSGNLDSIFVFFYILTIYFSAKSSKHVQWFPSAMAAFAGLVLSKTLVGFSAAVLILFLNYHHLFKLRRTVWWLVGGIGVFGAIFLPWYISSYYAYPDFIQHHFLQIGTRDKTFMSYFQLHAAQPLYYIHMGMRKWYYFWYAGLAYMLISFAFLRKQVALLLIWNAVVLYPFLTATQTELWHLIPVYIPISLIIAVSFYELSQFIRQCMNVFVPSLHRVLRGRLSAKSTVILYIIMFLVIAVMQYRIFRPEVYQESRYTPDDVDIAQKVSKYPEKIYLDDDYTPLAVYYSGRNMLSIGDQPSTLGSDKPKSLVSLFQTNDTNFVVITRSWAVQNLISEHIPYKLREKNNSFSIVSRP